MRDIPDKSRCRPFRRRSTKHPLYPAGIYTPSWTHLWTILLRRSGQLYINQDLSYTSCRGAEFRACIFRRL